MQHIINLFQIETFIEDNIGIVSGKHHRVGFVDKGSVKQEIVSVYRYIEAVCVMCDTCMVVSSMVIKRSMVTYVPSWRNEQSKRMILARAAEKQTHTSEN